MDTLTREVAALVRFITPKISIWAFGKQNSSTEQYKLVFRKLLLDLGDFQRS